MTQQAGQPDPRQKRTLWLMAGGIASLLLPLGGVVYLRYSNSAAHTPIGNPSFERREEGDAKIIVSQAGVPFSAQGSPSPLVSGGARPAGSSLDFVKSGSDFQQEKQGMRPPGAFAQAPPPARPAAALPASAPLAAEPPETDVSPPLAAIPSRPAKKPFFPPKLQPGKGFTNFRSGAGSGAQAPISGAGSSGGGLGTSGGGSVQDILNSVPPSVRNSPEFQRALREQGQ